jgi:hypothetical protein
MADATATTDMAARICVLPCAAAYAALYQGAAVRKIATWG